MQITTPLLLRSPARAPADEKGNIHFVYDATGRKWAKSAYATAPADENGPEGLRWYVDNAEFLDGKIQHVAFPGGRFVAEYDENGAFQGTYRAEYLPCRQLRFIHILV